MTMHNDLTDIRWTARETGFTGNSPKGQRTWVPVKRWSDAGETLAANLTTVARLRVDFESFEYSSDERMVFLADVRELTLYPFDPITMKETGDQLRIPVQVPITASNVINTQEARREQPTLMLGRIASMVNNAVQSGAKRITLRTMNAQMRLNGPGSSRPGTLSIDKSGYGSDFYGYVNIEYGGIWKPFARTPQNVIDQVRAFDADPEKFARDYAAATLEDTGTGIYGRCCFCNLHLTDPRSTSMGYGPICAGKYQLPWGDTPKARKTKATRTKGERKKAKIVKPFAWPKVLQPIVTNIKSNLSPSTKLGISAAKQGVSFHAIDECEVCGTPCEGTNLSPWYGLEGKPKRWYLDLAQSAHDAGAADVGAYPELGACEALDGIAVCPACYQDDEEDDE
jgi:hypothetical protein